jgi:hypothetical protein
MTNSSMEAFEPMLLDYHLGQLGPEQVHELEAALDASPELTAKSDAVLRLLKPLESFDAPTLPANLTDRVLDHIAQSRTYSFEQAASSLPPAMETEMSSSPFVSIRELVAIAACITIFVGVCVPAYYRVRNVAERTYCLNNLRGIGEGLAQYTNDFAGQLPVASRVEHASWLPVNTPGVQVASNRRHPFLLLKLDYIEEPKTFICPSRPGDVPMIPLQGDEVEGGRYVGFDDFAQSTNISYAYQNMSGPASPSAERSPAMVVTGDTNPLFEDGRIHALAPYEANSRTHGERAGQNAAKLDGSAAWQTTPTCGVGNDHIFTAGNITRYTGTEVPQSSTDSFLIP